MSLISVSNKLYFYLRLKFLLIEKLDLLVTILYTKKKLNITKTYNYMNY